MVHGTRSLVSAGDSLAHRSGPVLVAVTCIRPDAAYRVSVCYGSTGAEVDELSQSFPTEALARGVARATCLQFADGRSIESVLTERAEAARRSALAVVDAARDANVLRASSTRRYAEERILDTARDDLLDPATRADLDARRAALRDHILTAWTAPQPVAEPIPADDDTLFVLFTPTSGRAA